MDEGIDSTLSYKSLTSGVDPVLQGFDSEKSEVQWIADQVRELCPGGAEDYSNCCVVLRTNALRNKYARGLKSLGLDAVTLEQRADNQSVAGVRLATMHRVKGLEFRHVILAGMSSRIVPNNMAVKDSEDPVERRDNETRERALVHVASTRAIEHLLVSWYGDMCEFIHVA